MRLRLPRNSARLVATAFVLAIAAPKAVLGQANGGPLGDVNLDGTLDVLDAQLILLRSVGMAVPSTAAPIPWGDVNADGFVTPVDAQIVLAKILGLNTGAYPVGTRLARVRSIALTPQYSTVQVGSSGTIGAVPRDSANNTLGVRMVTWSSSAPSILSITASGQTTATTALFTGVSAGSATITALSEGVSATFLITVSSSASDCVLSGGEATPLQAMRDAQCRLRPNIAVIATRDAVETRLHSVIDALVANNASQAFTLASQYATEISSMDAGTSGAPDRDAIILALKAVPSASVILP